MNVDIVLTVVSLVLLVAGAIGAVQISRSARATMRESVDGVPPRLPGIWPSFAERRYARLSHEERKAWWKRLRFVRNYVIMPLISAVIVAFFLFPNVFVFVAFGALIAATFFYSISGGQLPHGDG